MRPTRSSSARLNGTVRTCSGGDARLSQRWATSPSRVHCTHPCWFVSAPEPTLPGLRLVPDRLRCGEGTFLSVEHCQQPSCSRIFVRVDGRYQPVACSQVTAEVAVQATAGGNPVVDHTAIAEAVERNLAEDILVVEGCSLLAKPVEVVASAHPR